MNTTQVLEVLIPMLVMLATFVGLALRVQTNLSRSVDRSIDKFRNELRKDREDDRKELKDFPHRSTKQPRQRPHRSTRQPRGGPQSTRGLPHRGTGPLRDHQPQDRRHRRRRSRGPRPIRDLPHRDPGELQGTRRQGRHQRRHPRQEHQEGRRPGSRLCGAGLQSRGLHRSHIQRSVTCGRQPVEPLSGRRSLVAGHRPDRMRSAVTALTTAGALPARRTPLCSTYIYVLYRGWGDQPVACTGPRSADASGNASDSAAHDRRIEEVAKGSGVFAQPVAAVERSLDAAPAWARARDRPVERGRRSPPSATRARPPATVTGDGRPPLRHNDRRPEPGAGRSVRHHGALRPRGAGDQGGASRSGGRRAGVRALLRGSQRVLRVAQPGQVGHGARPGGPGRPQGVRAAPRRGRRAGGELPPRNPRPEGLRMGGPARPLAEAGVRGGERVRPGPAPIPNVPPTTWWCRPWAG